MLGTGSIIITHSTGWACSNEAIMGIEADIRPDKTAKKTLVIEIRGLFNAIGTLSGTVSGIFKLDTSDKPVKVAFNGYMHGKNKVVLTGETNNDFQIILKSIEKWQEHYQVS